MVVFWLGLGLSIAAPQSQPKPVEPQSEAARRLLEERDKFGEDAERFRDEGKLVEAIAAAQKMLDIERDVLGNEHDDVLGSLELLAEMYAEQETFDAARNARAEVLATRLKHLAADHWQVTDARVALAHVDRLAKLDPAQRATLREASDLANSVGELYDQGRYQEALEPARRALDLHRDILGSSDLRTTTCLNNVALLLQELGNVAQAEPLYRESVRLHREILGAGHPDTAMACVNLAELYLSLRDYERAEPLYKQGLEICETTLGPRHSATAICLNNLAMMYQSQGDFARSEPLLLKSLEIREANLGPRHPDTAKCMMNVAVLCDSLGEYANAESLYERCLEVLEETVGPEHILTSTCLNNLAGLYESTGEYARAEPLYRRSLDICSDSLGARHANTAICLNNLAGVYESMGDHSKAELLYRRSLEILRETQGPEHPDTATCLNNLAALYQAMGDFTRSLPLQERSLEIRQKALGPRHADVAQSLNNLAVLSKSMGEFTTAERQFRQSLAVYEKVYGSNHPTTATAMRNLANVHLSLNDYSSAEPLLQRSSKIFHDVLGERHPYTAECIKDQALVDWARNDHSRAANLLLRALSIARGNLELTAAVQSQRQQLAMTKSLRGYLDSYISLASTMDEQTEVAYSNVLQWKGAVLTRQRRARAVSDQPEVAETYGQLQATTRRLATLALGEPAPGQQVAWHRQIDELSAARERFEADLTGRSGTYREASQEVTVRDVASSLPADTALVDYLEYRHFAPAPIDMPGPDTHERRLVAFIVRPNQGIKLVSLGSVKLVAELVDAWGTSYGSSAESRDAGTRLRARIWDPLEASLAGARRVLISPDGVLGRFPFAALPGKEPGKYLLQEQSVAVIPVAQSLPDLMRRGGGKKADGTLLLIGGVDYEAEGIRMGESEPVRPPEEISRQAERGSAWRAFAPLHGTLGELVAIEKLHQNLFGDEGITVLRGSEPSESRFLGDAPRHRYLHVATHGYFAPPELRSVLQGDNRPESAAAPGAVGRPTVMGRSPGLLSGLALAGANRPPSPDEDDGILTADEVENVDLRGVELAMLSACETGLGDVAGGEGLLGLQRAFQVAGARSVVATLWKVDDEQTRLLMERFYSNLWEKDLSKLDALLEAQRWMLREGPRRGPTRGVTRDDNSPEIKSTIASPYYWAPFVLSGDWR